MAKERIWITWLPPAEEGAPAPQETVVALQKYGHPTGGGPWIDKLAQMAWTTTGLTLLDTEAADLWLIAGRQADWERPSVRTGLALAAAMAQGIRGHRFPIVAVALDGVLDPAALPTPLANALCVDGSKPAWGIKIAPGLKRFATLPAPEYRLAITAEPHIGLWIEVGPRDGEWNGALFGVSGGHGAITHQAVGPKEELPSKTVLEYPMNGIQLTAGDRKYTACAASNQIDAATSYYVKIAGTPEHILFGGHPDSDAEVYLISLV